MKTNTFTAALAAALVAATSPADHAVDNKQATPAYIQTLEFRAQRDAFLAELVSGNYTSEQLLALADAWGGRAKDYIYSELYDVE